jgi:hypothetical protein
MSESTRDPVGRRDFLKNAAAGAAGFVPGLGETQQPAAADPDHQVVPSDVALRVKALESLLVEKGMVNSADIDATVDLYENRVGPRNGARVVARAWIDPEYRKRLLDESTGTKAIAELGYSGGLFILLIAFIDEFINVLRGNPPRYEKPKPQTAEEVVEQAIQSGV